jgi:hypothetical protein
VGAIDGEIGNSRFRLALGILGLTVAHNTALSIWVTHPLGTHWRMIQRLPVELHSCFVSEAWTFRMRRAPRARRVTTPILDNGHELAYCSDVSLFEVLLLMRDRAHARRE